MMIYKECCEYIISSFIIKKLVKQIYSRQMEMYFCFLRANLTPIAVCVVV